MTPAELNMLVAVSALVVIAGVIAVRVAARSGMPGLLWYIGFGLALGESGFGIRFDDPDLTFNVASVLLAILLIDGGFTTSWRSIRPVLAPAGLMASAGVLISVAVTALLTWAVLGVEPRVAILFAAMVSSTDAAATFSILRRLPIKSRLRTLLEAESGFNDPLVIILVTVVASDAWDNASVLGLAGDALYQLVIGAIFGLLIGRIGQLVLVGISLPSAGLYPLATLAIALGGFAVTGLAGGSGLLAAYVIGLWLGNQALPHKRTSEGFNEALGHLSQIGLFVMLGLLASPSKLWEATLPAIVIGSVLTFIARPFSVLVCLTPFRFSIREQSFVSWAGLRGAVPIVLATIPLTLGLPDAWHIFHVIFLLVVFFTIVQGPLLPLVARWMGVTEELCSHDIAVESAPLEGVRASLVQFQVPRGSQLIGMHVDELRMPSGAVLTMLIRGGEIIVPKRTQRLRADDQLLFAVRNSLVERTQNRLIALSRDGRLARWRMSAERWRQIYGPRRAD